MPRRRRAATGPAFAFGWIVDCGQSAVAVAVFVVIGSVTVAGPVLFFVLAPSTAGRPLGAIKEFMSDHNAVIMMVVLLILGTKLLGNGIAGSRTDHSTSELTTLHFEEHRWPTRSQTWD